MYVFLIARRRKASPSFACAASFLATRITPEVSLSSRCTIPGPQRIAGLRKRLPTSQQRVDKRARCVARPRMHRHACGLVDGDDIFILVKHIEGNRFRCRDNGRSL